MIRMACRDLTVAFNVCTLIVVTQWVHRELCPEFRFHLHCCLEALIPRSTWSTAWMTLKSIAPCSKVHSSHSLQFYTTSAKSISGSVHTKQKVNSLGVKGSFVFTPVLRVKTLQGHYWSKSIYKCESQSVCVNVWKNVEMLTEMFANVHRDLQRNISLWHGRNVATGHLLKKTC